MTFKALTELTWVFYQNGKSNATDQDLKRSAIAQRLKLAIADGIRQRYYESKKMDDFGRPDFSFVSPMIDIKRFVLSDENEQGRFRRCDMSESSLYRLPGNTQITNIYPVGKCGTDEVGEITQVAAGEENFYINNPDLKNFSFFVIKGKGVNVYNIPLCVEKLDIEAVYDGDDMEVDSALASAAMDQVLNVGLGIKKQYYGEEAKRQIDDQNVIK